MDFVACPKVVYKCCLYCYRDTCRLKQCNGCSPAQRTILDKIKKEKKCLFCAFGTCKKHEKIKIKKKKVEDGEWQEVRTKNPPAKEDIKTILLPAPKNGKFYSKKVKEDLEVVNDIIFQKYFVENGISIYECDKIQGKWSFSYQDFNYIFTPDKIIIKSKSKKNIKKIHFKPNNNNINFDISFADIATKYIPSEKKSNPKYEPRPESLTPVLEDSDSDSDYFNEENNIGYIDDYDTSVLFEANKVKFIKT
mgnify:CR=1 FL=1